VREHKRPKVFPTCAGVILEEQEKAMNTKGVPRVCGGDPGLKRA